LFVAFTIEEEIEEDEGAEADIAAAVAAMALSIGDSLS
jgi:hypothetical protein